MRNETKTSAAMFDQPSCAERDMLYRWVAHVETQSFNRGISMDCVLPRMSFRPRKKLTPEIVRAIRADDRHDVTIAAERGVARQTIYKIRTWLLWKDVK